jgi:hypothetical protein
LDLPAPLKPNAKQIGLFLNLSSYCRKQGAEADLVHCVSMQKQRVSFLSEEVCPEQIQEMEKFYDRSISGLKSMNFSINNPFFSVRRSCRNQHHQHFHRASSGANSRRSEETGDGAGDQDSSKDARRGRFVPQKKG